MKSFSINHLVLLILICFPYLVFDELISAFFVASSASLAIMNGLFNARVPKIYPLYIFFTIIIFWTIIALVAGTEVNILIRQANHFWQYIVLALGFVYATSRVDIAEFLLSPFVRSLLIISVSLTFFSDISERGYVYGFTPNTIFLLASCLVDRKNRFYSAIVSIYIISVFALTGNRATPFLIIAIFCASLFFAPRTYFTKSLCLLIISFSILAPILIDESVLYEILKLDHNSYIRAEFLRGAWPIMQEHMLTGVGFGSEYRQYGYTYLTDHPLLRLPQHLTYVSNHNSFFDTALRLGIPATLALIYAIYIRPSFDKKNKLAFFIMVALTVGLSANAWFEDQNQLANVAFMSAYLSVLRKREKDISSSNIKGHRLNS